jgi:threonylcarbamoyladenosine tRNA methylthiotransferase MtaB
VVVLTLGCKVNQNESLALAAALKAEGAHVADRIGAEAEVYVVNTCTVTHVAGQKSRKLIRKIIREHPGAKVVVTGCYAETEGETIRNIPGVSLVAGNRNKPELAGQIRRLAGEGLWTDPEARDPEAPALGIPDPEALPSGFFPAAGVWDPETRTRATLKIQDGCRQFCSYCVIPYVRGDCRSLDELSVCRGVERLASAGCREIVLTGIHLGAYGLDRGETDGLGKLLEILLPRFPRTRIRLSSLEPMEVSERILALMGTWPHFCDHLHLPLQSGHDDLLKAMNRPYNTARYRAVAEKARAVVPDVAITTDCMVGFPGETEDHFRMYLDFVREMAFSRLHVFAFSPRKGTAAAAMGPQIPNRIKQARSRALIELGQDMARAYGARFMGRMLPILVERSGGPEIWEGHAPNYLMVRFQSPVGDSCDYTGRVVNLEIVSQTRAGLTGRMLN